MTYLKVHDSFLRNKNALSKTIPPHCMLVLLQITYYVLRRDRPEEWKCQPYHWLPKDLEIHEMSVGAFSLAIGSFISSTMACWIMNGGWTSIYFDHTEHGYLWLLIQTPLVFIWQVKLNFSWKVTLPDVIFVKKCQCLSFRVSFLCQRSSESYSFFFWKIPI